MSRLSKTLASRFRVELIGAPQALAPGNNPLAYDTPLYDGLNECALPGGQFTPIRTGYYLLTAETLLTNATAGNPTLLLDMQSGALGLIGEDYIYPNVATLYNQRITCMVYLVAGDNIWVEYGNPFGAIVTILNNPHLTYFSGHRLS